MTTQPTLRTPRELLEPAPRTSRDSVRDTIDSIVVAFILAFVFRAFIVEAFIIPTGSMAPSLYGKHGQHRCSNCNYTYAFGIDESTVQQAFTLTCPNCGHFRDLVGGPRQATLVDSGDRILVLKWPYDIAREWLGPRRWSVVVFKNPADGKQNYIKRLLGMPGEVLQIVDGDIYAAPADKISPELRDKLLADPLKVRDRGLSGADLAGLDKVLKIQRKPATAQSSLWMIHYDHDFPPIERHPESPGWDSGGSTADTGWTADTPRVTFDGRGDDDHDLSLVGKPIGDYYAYNAKVFHGDYRRTERLVGDVRLRFLLTPEKGGDGHVSATLARREDEFTARIDGNGRVTLTHRAGKLPARTIDTAAIDAFEPGRSLLVEYEILDYRVCLRIDGREVVSTSDSEYAPDLAALRGALRGEDASAAARVSIAARGLPLTIQHLAVHRDVFYRSIRTEEGAPGLMNPYAAANVPAWGTVNNPILLREGEYFVCGDNSPASKDSRLWWEAGDFVQRRGDDYQRGTVPADQLIGQAFFVYWPGGHRLGERGLPVVPNVGRMRIIR